MTDPGWPGGLLIGHGGGGPGYAAATFAVLREARDPLVAIELSGDERVDVQATALDELRELYLRRTSSDRRAHPSACVAGGDRDRVAALAAERGTGTQLRV